MPELSQSTPVISLVVPVYNAESYLDQCLSSLKAQTFKDIEIICINDGSTDNSQALLEAYAQKDERFRVLSRENRGASYTRNQGMEIARGRYLMFVDSDDYIAKDACAHLVEIAERDNADIVVFGGKTFPTVNWADGSFAKNDAVYTGKSIDALLYENGSAPLMCNKLYSAELLRKSRAQFNTDLTLGEDNAFQFCVFPHAQTVSYTKKILYFYRFHDTSVMGTFEQDHDAKIYKHFEVVSYVVTQWHAQGLLVEHGRELLEWLVVFLHNDMRYASFNPRADLAQKLEGLIKQFFTEAQIDDMNDTVWGKLAFMLATQTAAQKPPLVTFIVTRLSSGIYPVENLHSLTNQDEQRIECLIDESLVDDTIEAAVHKDRRCHIVSNPTFSSLLKRCTAPFVIFTHENCSYVLSTVGQLIDHLDILGRAKKREGTTIKEQAFKRGEYVRGTDALHLDAVVFRDQAARLRMEDPYFAREPVFDKPLMFDQFSHTDLSSRIHNICSLSACNKLFSLEFLKRATSTPRTSDGATFESAASDHVTSDHEASDRTILDPKSFNCAALAQQESPETFEGLVAHALEHAQTIALFLVPLLKFGIFVSEVNEPPKKDNFGKKDLKKEGLEKKVSLTQPDTESIPNTNSVLQNPETPLSTSIRFLASTLSQKSFSGALTEYCLALDDALYDHTLYSAAIPVLRETVIACRVQEDETLLFHRKGDKDQLKSLASETDWVHFANKSSHYLSTQTAQYDTAMLELGEALGLIARQGNDITEVYNSISYRAGRAVTAPVRFVYYFMKRLVQRRSQPNTQTTSEST